MGKRIRFDIKEQMVGLSGACFWYWNSFYSFLDSSGVPRQVYQRYPRDAFNKYQAMRNILADLEKADQTEIVDSLIASFYRLKSAVDRDKLDEQKAKSLLGEFRESVGDDPIEAAIEEKQQRKARVAYKEWS